MLLETLRFIFGILFSLFLPGFIFSLVLFNDLEILERIVLSFGISVFLDVLLAFLLGISKTMKSVTGGIVSKNIWIGQMSITLVLLIIYIIKIKFYKK